MKVKTIMTSPVTTVHPDDSLLVVNTIFASQKFHHLLVVEDKKLHGVVSDRDLFKAISPNLGKAAEKAVDLATLNKKVHQIMSRQPVCVEEEDSVRKAIALFDAHGFSCLPVVNAKQVPVGILSWRDIIKMIQSRL